MAGESYKNIEEATKAAAARNMACRVVDVDMPEQYADWLDEARHTVPAIIDQALLFGLKRRDQARLGRVGVVVASESNGWESHIAANLPPLGGAFGLGKKPNIRLPRYVVDPLDNEQDIDNSVSVGQVLCDGLVVVGGMVEHSKPGVDLRLGFMPNDKYRPIYTDDDSGEAVPANDVLFSVSFADAQYHALPPLPHLTNA